MNIQGLLAIPGIEQIPIDYVEEGCNNNLIEIPEGVKTGIDNILLLKGKKNKKIINLRDLLLLLQATGGIALSNNPINGFEQEKELKIPNINIEEVINRVLQLKDMDEWEAQIVFIGRIMDVYFDTKDLELDKNTPKRSFRIRKKISSNNSLIASLPNREKFTEGGLIEKPDCTTQYYYTAKRKLDEEETKGTEIVGRTCFEQEYKIYSPIALIAFLKILKGGIVPVRRKEKLRISIDFQGARLDIDIYPGLDPMLEIEAETNEKADEILEMLGLSGKTKLNCGTRGFYEDQGEEFPTYTQKELKKYLPLFIGDDS